ncbi:hypothetical protein [Streptomyces sp. NPDC053367]|uniref:hypothetical protein n=1 Tax=Streptomyces sp. NPDC053367 TaxID=3365700 RepID=UPI0037CE7715
MHGGTSRWRGGLLAGGIAVAALVLTGCAGQPQPVGAAASPAAPGLRRDEEPVRARFPEFGDFTSSVWLGEVLGQNHGRPAVPGPTDVRMAGVVRLTAVDAARLRDTYTWQDAPAQPALPEGLRPEVPAGARWRTSAGFTRAVTGGLYPAAFHADLDRKVLVFDAVNPETKKA